MFMESHGEGAVEVSLHCYLSNATKLHHCAINKHFYQVDAFKPVWRLVLWFKTFEVFSHEHIVEY